MQNRNFIVWKDADVQTPNIILVNIKFCFSSLSDTDSQIGKDIWLLFKWTKN